MQWHEFRTICVPFKESLLITFHLEDNDNDNMEIVNVKLKHIYLCVFAHFWVRGCYCAVT